MVDHVDRPCVLIAGRDESEVLSTAIQSKACWHEYDRSAGRHLSGLRAPLERLVLAVTAIKC